jgi:hypothetical protein
VSNYKAAKAANISRIDAYLFPCTGNQANGVLCKSPATQISEFLAAIDENGMTISHYWFDLEPTPGGECEAWNLGSAANEALAKQWVAELQKTGRNWGIYANGSVWKPLFRCLWKYLELTFAVGTNGIPCLLQGVRISALNFLYVSFRGVDSTPFPRSNHSISLSPEVFSWIFGFEVQVNKK